MSELPKKIAHIDPPPFLGTWRRVYAAVLIYLAVVITLCYCFARVFAPEP